MKKTNTTTATMNTTTTNTTTKEGAETMKKTTTKTTKTTTKTAPKAETAPAQDKPQESKPQETPKAKKDDRVTVSVPKLSRVTVAATETDAEREGYGLKWSEKKTAFTRVSITGQELVSRVQLALGAECMAQIDAELATVDALRIDADEEQSARDLATLQAADLRAARKALLETLPGLEKYEREAADNRHARLLACALGGYYLPLSLEKWETAAAATFAAFRGTLSTKIDGHGTREFTEGERANISALKAATVETFSAYCAETTISRAFTLRVKDADVLDWYEMSKNGYAGERKRYAARARLGQKGQNGYRRALVAYFLGAILRDAEDAEPVKK